MELLNKQLNDLKNSSKAIRCSAYKKLHSLVQSQKGELTQQQAFDIIRSCIAGFEDVSERCREEAVQMATLLLDTQDHNILDWVLPAVVTRIGLEKIVEDSEEIRLLLLRLGFQCMTCFPHEIGPRKFIDFFQALLINCYSDQYPEIKKEACRATIQLCTIEPKEVAFIAVPLGKALKTTCLVHKHAAVRCEGVRTLAKLVAHGAEELLTQGKMEPDQATTEYNLFILANDHSESVRRAVLDVVSASLMDVRNRLEHHRTFLPHLLLLATDSFSSVREEATRILASLGKLYMIDQEDNRIDISKRPVSMKDIEWYADDDAPDMSTLSEEVKQRYPILCSRPSLGTRYVVAEAARNLLKKNLADIRAMDWVIPYSNNNRKAVALRILWLLLFHCEKNCVQFVEQVLGAVYKALRDESVDVVAEASLCMEIIGKFLTPDQYLPILIQRPSVKSENSQTGWEEGSVTHKTKRTTVVMSSAEEKENTKAPSLFSREASTVKCSILLSIGFLVSGSKERLTPTHASQLTHALTDPEVLESESEELLLSVLTAYEAVLKVFTERKFIATEENPLPEDVQNNPMQRTIDSIFLHALLILKGSSFPSVRRKAGACAEQLSIWTTNTSTGIYDRHVRRILHRYGSTLPVQAFSDLVLLASNKTAFGDDLLPIFVSRLAEVNFKINVTEELRYFGVLEQLLWNQDFCLSTPSLVELLRVVILPLAAFNANHVASLFRKIAVNCLCAVSADPYAGQLKETVEQDNALGNKIVTLWCSASDGDDSEMRLVCATALANMARYPITEGVADEMVQSVILRLDDTSDLIRLRCVDSLSLLLKNSSDTNGVSCTFLKELRAKMVPLTKKLLLYLDDQDETVGLRPVIEECVKYLGLLSPHIVIDLTRDALPKHINPTPCENIINFLLSNDGK